MTPIIPFCYAYTQKWKNIEWGEEVHLFCYVSTYLHTEVNLHHLKIVQSLDLLSSNNQHLISVVIVHF